jgi:hypothetical protein
MDHSCRPRTAALRRRPDGTVTLLINGQEVRPRPPAVIPTPPPCPVRAAAKRAQGRAQLLAILHPRGGAIVSGRSAASRNGKRNVGR